jgi:hypothetical protein
MMWLPVQSTPRRQAEQDWQAREEVKEPDICRPERDSGGGIEMNE